MTKTVFREMTEKNAYFSGKLQSSMVTGLMFAVCDKQQQLWEGGLGAPSHRVTRRKAIEETEEEDRNKEEVTVVLKRPATSHGTSRTSGIIVRLATNYLPIPEYILIPEYPKRTRPKLHDIADS